MPAFDTAAREGFLKRLERLTPEHQPKFGSLSAARMVAHLTMAVGGSLEGAKALAGGNAFMRTGLFHFLVLYVLPWPKGKIKVPASLTPEVSGSPADHLPALREAMERFARAAEATPAKTSLHPMFGNLTYRTWAKFHHRHFQHHLDQFGV